MPEPEASVLVRRRFRPTLGWASLSVSAKMNQPAARASPPPPHSLVCRLVPTFSCSQGLSSTADIIVFPPSLPLVCRAIARGGADGGKHAATQLSITPATKASHHRIHPLDVISSRSYVPSSLLSRPLHSRSGDYSQSSLLSCTTELCSVLKKQVKDINTCHNLFHQKR